MVLSTFDEGVDLVLFYKYMMTLEGNPEYELHFNPTDALSESQKTFARQQLQLFKRWYASWATP
jgi:4-hydroxy-tetrahydrodipicolinate synthase